MRRPDDAGDGGNCLAGARVVTGGRGGQLPAPHIAGLGRQSIAFARSSHRLRCARLPDWFSPVARAVCRRSNFTRPHPGHIHGAKRRFADVSRRNRCWWWWRTVRQATASGGWPRLLRQCCRFVRTGRSGRAGQRAFATGGLGRNDSRCRPSRPFALILCRGWPDCSLLRKTAGAV